MRRKSRLGESDPSTIYKYVIFSFPCKEIEPPYMLKNSRKRPYKLKEGRQSFALGQPRKGYHPLHFQLEYMKWIGYNVLYGPRESLAKLKDIAEEHKVSFLDLCVYALNYPVSGVDKPNPRVKPEKIKVNIDLQHKKLPEELNKLTWLVFGDDDLKSKSCREFLLAYLICLLFGNKTPQLLAMVFLKLAEKQPRNKKIKEIYWYINKHQDAYGQFIPDELFDHTKIGYEHVHFYSIITMTKSALNNFALAKLDAKDFSVLNIKAIQKELVKVIRQE